MTDKIHGQKIATELELCFNESFVRKKTNFVELIEFLGSVYIRCYSVDFWFILTIDSSIRVPNDQQRN